MGTSEETAMTKLSRAPLPAGVMEQTGIGPEGGIVERRDGSLLLAQGRMMRTSTDRGRRWSDPQTLNGSLDVGGMIRLQSGSIGMYGSRQGRHFFALSQDEGATWSEPSFITDYPTFFPLYHAMIQLRSGRLLICGYTSMMSWDEGAGTMISVHPDLQYADVSAYGSWRGQKIAIEGHGHAPEMGMTVVYRSDDEGRTWAKHPGGLMGWFDFDGVVNGNCGLTPCFEPTLAEARDGNVLLMMRSTVGRLVQSHSTDGGEHWNAVTPSNLASSESPAITVTLPKTGDLLIVWNQQSREEIRRGYRRGRLSSAISRDGGHSWENFKTLEICEGLADVERLPPEFPIQMVRARDWVGPLPDGWAYYHYANIDIAGDNVLLRYNRGGPLLGIAEQDLNKQEAVMRIYPIEWFRT